MRWLPRYIHESVEVPPPSGPEVPGRSHVHTVGSGMRHKFGIRIVDAYSEQGVYDGRCGGGVLVSNRDPPSNLALLLVLQSVMMFVARDGASRARSASRNKQNKNKKQFSGITTETLQDTMKELLLLNTAFQENKEFYEVYARDHVISELTNPVSNNASRV